MADFTGTDPSDPNQKLPPPYLYNQYDPYRQGASQFWRNNHFSVQQPGGYGQGGNNSFFSGGAYGGASFGQISDPTGVGAQMNQMYGGIGSQIGGYLNRVSNLRAQYRALNANRQQDQMIMGNPTAGTPTGVRMSIPQLNMYRSNYSQVQPALGGYVGLYSRAMNNVDQMFGQEKQDVATQYNGMAGQGYQDMISRGMTGSTVASSMKAEVASQRAQAMNRVDADAARQRLSADLPISMAMLNYSSGVKNAYPNYNPAAASGIAGYGYGGGY